MNRKQKILKIAIILLGMLILFAMLFSTKRISIQGIGANLNDEKNVIFQTKENNCGPVALKMIFDHYKIPATLVEIENKVGLNNRGTSMLALKEMADLKGLHAEGWRLSLEDFLKTTFPVILFVNEDHYIVADSVVSDTLFFRDPALGKLRLRINKLPEKWNGETLVFKQQ
jgi:uncharacterized protein